MMDIQRILVMQPQHEVWLQLHPAIANFGGIYGNGCKWVPDLIADYASLPEIKKINWILWTYIQWFGLYPLINGLKDAYHVDVYGGAEYADGIVTSTDIAMANRIRGLVCGPLHTFTNHDHIEPWMVENIKEAYRKWGGRM
jgi:hypothetical protein